VPLQNAVAAFAGHQDFFYTGQLVRRLDALHECRHAGSEGLVVGQQCRIDHEQQVAGVSLVFLIVQRGFDQRPVKISTIIDSAAPLYPPNVRIAPASAAAGSVVGAPAATWWA